MGNPLPTDTGNYIFWDFSVYRLIAFDCIVSREFYSLSAKWKIQIVSHICVCFQVDSKIVLGLSGVLIVLLSVASAIGICSYMQIPGVSTLPYFDDLYMKLSFCQVNVKQKLNASWRI